MHQVILNELSTLLTLGLVVFINVDSHFVQIQCLLCIWRENKGSKLVNFQWKRSADCSKEVNATFGSEGLKDVSASEALRTYTSFNYFICNITVVICKLDIVFCF